MFNLHFYIYPNQVIDYKSISIHLNNHKNPATIEPCQSINCMIFSLTFRVLSRCLTPIEAMSIVSSSITTLKGIPSSSFLLRKHTDIMIRSLSLLGEGQKNRIC